MRVLYIGTSNCIRIDGLTRTFLPQSLSATEVGGYVSIWEGDVELVRQAWGRFRDPAGAEFASLAGLMSYLDATLSQDRNDLALYDPGDLAALFLAS